MTDGDYVEITCEGAAAEDESRIEWYFNNRVCIDVQLIWNIKIRYFKKKFEFKIRGFNCFSLLLFIVNWGNGKF